VRRERIGNASEVVREHRHAGGGGGEVRVQMCDRLTRQKICQVTGLEKTLQKTPSRVKQQRPE
jgi:hypothetical protein